jgi:catechol 2,3-dioxygenase-like lactoylglutathione lyase family enzyme
MSETEHRSKEPHLNELFNIGVKAPDVEAEKAFFEAFNPSRHFFLDRTKSTVGPKMVPAVEVGKVSFFLFSSLSYDGDLPQPQPGGISHVAFMVDSMDALVANLAKHGYKPLRGPLVFENADLGRRKVAFFRSPNGTIIEPQEQLK